MAAQSWDKGQPYVLPIDGIAEIMYGALEVDSSTFKAGALVYSDQNATDGTIKGFTAGAAVTSPAVLGIAQKDATNVTTGNVEIPVQLIHPGDVIFIKHTVDGTETTVTATVPVPLVEYGLYVDANGVAYLDSNVEDQDCFVYIEPVKDVNGDYTSWCKARLTASASQAGPAA